MVESAPRESMTPSPAGKPFAPFEADSPAASLHWHSPMVRNVSLDEAARWEWKNQGTTGMPWGRRMFESSPYQYHAPAMTRACHPIWRGRVGEAGAPGLFFLRRLRYT